MAKAMNTTARSSSNKTTTNDQAYLLNLDKEHHSTCENFILIWLDANLDLLGDDFRYLIERFQSLVHLIIPFLDPHVCLDFITKTRDEKIFLIISGGLGEELISILKHCEQIDSIYIYCDNTTKHKTWAEKETKIKGVFQDLTVIFDAFRRDIRQCEDDFMRFKILSPNYNRNQNNNLDDQSFIYTQLLKYTLIEMDYKSTSKSDFCDICLCQYANNSYQINIIKEFKAGYQPATSIWWFTRECFIYSMLNKALRVPDIDMINQMGFFIRDLHRTIKDFHKKYNKQKRLVVYRGQGINEKDVHRILNNINGFLSFNNFLSTTMDKEASKQYASFARNDHGLIGVLFEIEIDQSKALFTPLDKLSYQFECDDQILFSIQNIFHIENVHYLEDGLCQIQLKLIQNENELLKDFKKLLNGNNNHFECLNIIKQKLQMLNQLNVQ